MKSNYFLMPAVEIISKCPKLTKKNMLSQILQGHGGIDYWAYTLMRDSIYFPDHGGGFAGLEWWQWIQLTLLILFLLIVISILAYACKQACEAFREDDDLDV